jgi:hypothetical protein
MPWKPAGNDENRVDAEVVAWLLVTGRKPFCSDDNAPQAPSIERNCRGILCRAGLHFDEGENPSATGDDIDFSAGYTRTPCENSPAVQAKPPARYCFGAAATFLRRLAIHFERSRARA